MIVRRQKPITIRNNCGCIIDEKELIKAILWYASKPVVSQKTIFIYGKYPAVSIHHEKIHVHRLLMAYWLNRPLQQSEYVHHVDSNRLNVQRHNLLVLDCSKHQSIHNKGRKQTLEHIRKRINATSSTRYGHVVYEHPHLLEVTPND